MIRVGIVTTRVSFGRSVGVLSEWFGRGCSCRPLLLDISLRWAIYLPPVPIPQTGRISVIGLEGGSTEDLVSALLTKCEAQISSSLVKPVYQLIT